MRIVLILSSVNNLYTKTTPSAVGKKIIEGYLYAMNNYHGRFSGRYGADELSAALIVTGILMLLAYPIFTTVYLEWLFIALGSAMIIWAVVRSLSTNIAKRRYENDAFVSFFHSQSSAEKKRRREEEKAKRAKRKEEEKVYAYFRCPKCRKELRVPRGKGKIRIKCPNCSEQFIRKT